jgi:hypothetical protein
MGKLFSFVGLIAALSAPAISSAKGIDLKPPARPAEDPGSATALLYKKPDAAHLPGRSIASASNCTDGTGTIYRKGSPGFASCLRTRALTQPERALPGNRGDSLLLFGK